ncbi:hypothetical protein [Moraxella caviae]|nr:hypothetical protein [Moraxella caviae]
MKIPYGKRNKLAKAFYFNRVFGCWCCVKKDISRKIPALIWFKFG